jgi:hypothetical protein
MDDEGLKKECRIFPPILLFIADSSNAALTKRYSMIMVEIPLKTNHELSNFIVIPVLGIRKIPNATIAIPIRCVMRLSNSPAIKITSSTYYPEGIRTIL